MLVCQAQAHGLTLASSDALNRQMPLRCFDRSANSEPTRESGPGGRICSSSATATLLPILGPATYFAGKEFKQSCARTFKRMTLGWFLAPSSGQAREIRRLPFPSPQPSPSGRGRTLFRMGIESSRWICPRWRSALPLLGERVRVRGNELTRSQSAWKVLLVLAIENSEELLGLPITAQTPGTRSADELRFPDRRPRVS